MKKQSYTFTLNEIEKLDDELNGIKNFNNDRVGVGLLGRETDLKLKFLLDQLNQSIQVYRTKSIEFRDNLIKKLGTPNENGIPNIPLYVNELQGGQEVQKTNPVYEKFQESLDKYLNKKVIFNTYPIDIDLLEKIESKDVYPYLFQFLVQQLQEEDAG